MRKAKKQSRPTAGKAKTDEPRDSVRRGARGGALVPSERGGTLAASERWTPSEVLASPFAFMRRFSEEMDRLFADFRLGAASLFPRLEPRWEGGARGASAWAPSLEVVERGGKLVVRADLPGLTKDDVKVEVRDDALAIHGERRQEREEHRKGVWRSERAYGSFYREIPLPEGVEPEQVKATFKNGVLEVTMPAPRPTKGRRIPIEGV